jgi:hypothetical protein
MTAEQAGQGWSRERGDAQPATWTGPPSELPQGFPRVEIADVRGERQLASGDSVAARRSPATNTASISRVAAP